MFVGFFSLFLVILAIPDALRVPCFTPFPKKRGQLHATCLPGNNKLQVHSQQPGG